MKKEWAFYQWTIENVARHFNVDIKDGLSNQEARTRLKKFGLNSLEKFKEISTFEIFLRQFSNFFVIILVIAAIISFYVDGPTQAAILLVIVFINVGLSFFQEFKAEKAILALKKSFQSTSKVIRGGKIFALESTEVVPGDLVVIEAGDKVPADVRLVETTSFEINESALTGESLPVSKNTKLLPLDTPLADRKNIVFASTVATSGHAKGIVIHTGAETEFGKIAGMISSEDNRTPLEKKIFQLGKVLTIIGAILCSIIFLLGYIRGFEVWKLLTFTIALLIAVVPESLPTAITLALAIGVTRMSKKKAIVRRLAVIEALGTTNIIATDKTGTITNNELNLKFVSLWQNGTFTQIKASNSLTSKDEKLVLDFLIHGVACSSVRLKKEDDFIGDPVEIAIVEKVESLGKLSYLRDKKYKKLMEIPFDSEKQYMAVMAEFGNEKTLIAKGAPEKIIGFSKFKTKAEKTLALHEGATLSRNGFKVIALAEKHLKNIESSVLSGLEFKGFFVIADDPVKNIDNVINKVVAAGIRPVIITGDHPETARFIANEIGMDVHDDEIMVEDDFLKLSKRELSQLLGRVKVFARVTPGDKTKIVQLFQKAGYSVAVTGDGVNDAPALKQAEVGIAMGLKGTDVAKESADIVLSDDRYATILSAIEYGRTIFDNIKNVITQLLSTNFTEVSLVFIAFVFGLPLPFITLQILWMNMVVENLAGLSMSFEEPSRHVLKEKPRPFGTNSMNGSLVYAAILAITSLILSLVVYLWGLNYSIAQARTFVFCFLVFSELFYALSIRSPKRIWQSPKSFIENKYLIVSMTIGILLQLALFYKPISSVFNIVPLKSSEWFGLAGMVLLAFFLAEIIRNFIDKRQYISVNK
jgi:P-type Ca2+ transporter type 2C